MNITIETLESRPNGFELVPYDDQTYQDFYKAEFRKGGIAIHDGAEVPEALQRFVEAKRLEFPDIRFDLEEVRIRDGIVNKEISWNYREEELYGGIMGISNNFFRVEARVASGELAFTTANGWIVLQKSEWSSPENVAGAMDRAFQNPLRKVESNRLENRMQSTGTVYAV